MGDDRNIPSNNEECDECVSYLCDSIYNMRHEPNGNTKCVRFSVHTIHFAISLFLRSKQGYDDLRASGLICLPLSQIISKKAS